MSDFGIGGVSRFDSFHGRTEGGLYHAALRYPNPFFDIGHTYLPPSISQLFRWCRYYFLTNPLINAVAYKMSEYPITPIIVEEEDPEVRTRWEEIIEQTLKLRTFQIETGLDYHTYGIGFVSIHFPIEKYLVCTNCKKREKVRACEYRFKNLRYELSCKACGTTGEAKVDDVNIKNLKGIRLIRWNPEYVKADHNEVTGETTYFFEIPTALRNDVTMGKKHIIERVPDVFVQALREQKQIRFTEDNLYVLKRPTIAQKDMGWGMPLILPVLKDVYYLQILRKAQEQIANQHIVPLRILFPQAGSGSADPYSTADLGMWRKRIEAEIQKWRQDCVSPETLVETDQGLRAARDVQVGDRLRNYHGTYSAVLNAWSRPLREGERAYQIVARGLRACDGVVSEGHPFYAARKQNNGNGHKLGLPEFIRAKDLSPGDYVGFPISRLVEDTAILDLGALTDRAATKEWVYADHSDPGVPEAFEHLLSGSTVPRKKALEETDWSVNQYKTAQIAVREARTLRRLPRFLPLDEEFCWVLGLYAAEGSCSAKQVLFALNRSEEEYLRRLRVFFEHRFGASAIVAERSENGIQVIFSSLIAAQVFSEVCPGDSRNKRVPVIIRTASERKVVAFLRGLLDGDGCPHDDGYSNKYTLALASRQLVEDVRQILLSFQILPGITYEPPAPYEIVGKRGMSHGATVLRVYGNAHARLLALLADEPMPPLGGEKIGVFRDGYVWHRIDEIRQVGAERVIGFQTDQENASVRLSDDTETHGTFCLWGMASANSNYIPILPLPIGNEIVGGEGKSLMLHQEMRAWSEQIVAGMQVPNEFIFGGMQYSGSNVSLRMLENQFLGYRTNQHTMCQNFILGRVADYMDWKRPKIRFQRFKMADDLQRLSLYFQMNQAMKISDTTLLNEADMDITLEEKYKRSEFHQQIENQRRMQLAQASLQGDVMLVQSRYQAQTQKIMQAAGMPPGGPGGPGGAPGDQGGQQQPLQGEQAAPGMPEGATVYPENAQQVPQEGVPLEMQSPLTAGQQQGGMNLLALARRAATQLQKVDDMTKQVELMKMKGANPQLYTLVLQLLFQEQGSQEDPLDPNQSPLAQQRPPRSQTPLV